MEAVVKMNFPAIIDGFDDVSEEYDLSWVNTNVSVMKRKLDLVRNLVNQEVDDQRFNEAINAIHFMVDKIPFMAMRLDAGAPIFRARANYGKLFSEKQEISYNITHADKISAGRFNRPAEPLFYGALRVENPKIDPVLHCALEACKELNDPDHPPAVQDITIGCWVNRGSLPLINLCFDDKHLSGNEQLRLAADKFKTETSKYFLPEASEFIFEFMRFFSELAWSVRENDNSYYILNAFLYAIRYYYANTRNTAIPGLIYPSAMTDGHGLNVVLVPQAVDHFLELEHVYMQRFFLVNHSKTYVSDPCSEFVKVVDGNFRFTKVRPYARLGKIFDYESSKTQSNP